METKWGHELVCVLFFWKVRAPNPNIETRGWRWLNHKSCSVAFASGERRLPLLTKCSHPTPSSFSHTGVHLCDREETSGSPSLRQPHTCLFKSIQGIDHYCPSKLLSNYGQERQFPIHFPGHGSSLETDIKMRNCQRQEGQWTYAWCSESPVVWDHQEQCPGPVVVCDKIFT